MKSRGIIQKEKGMRKPGKAASQVLRELHTKIREGITGLEINSFIETFIKHRYPEYRLSSKGYNSFPASSCISINEGIVHGIPSGRILRNGDLVKVDIVVDYRGWYADTAATYIVGSAGSDETRLVNATRGALFEGIQAAVPGNTTGDIGYSIQNYIEREGFSVMRDFCGHGIGRKMHRETNYYYGITFGKGIFDMAEKIRIKAVFTANPKGKPSWPYIDYDSGKRADEIMAVLEPHVPDIEFFRLVLYSAQEAEEMLAKEADRYDGYFLYRSGGMWTGAAQKIIGTGRPVVMVDDLYAGSGGFLKNYSYARKNSAEYQLRSKRPTTRERTLVITVCRGIRMVILMIQRMMRSSSILSTTGRISKV